MDIRLHWEEKGEGKPLILLHGNGEDGSYFKHQMEEFSPDYRVIALDTRGHGKSPRGAAPFSLSQFAEDLKEFLDERGIRRGIFLGFSDGGNIALLFALKYPSYVEALIVNGGNLDPSGVKRSVQLPIELGYGITGLFAPFSRKAKRNRELLGLMVKEPHIRPEELKKISVPALVIAGTDDMIKEEHTRLIGASLPGGQLKFVKGSHFAARDNSREFNRTVREFLEREVQS